MYYLKYILFQILNHGVVALYLLYYQIVQLHQKTKAVILLNLLSNYPKNEKTGIRSFGHIPDMYTVKCCGFGLVNSQNNCWIIEISSGGVFPLHSTVYSILQKSIVIMDNDVQRNKYIKQKI